MVAEVQAPVAQVLHERDDPLPALPGEVLPVNSIWTESATTYACSFRKARTTSR